MHQPVVADCVEELRQVDIHNPLRAAFQVLFRLLERRVTASARPKAVAPVVKRCTNLRAQHSEALENGETERLKGIVENTPEILRLRADDGTTFLGAACRIATADHALPPIPSTGVHLEIVDILLAAGSHRRAAERTR